MIFIVFGLLIFSLVVGFSTIFILMPQSWGEILEVRVVVEVRQ